MISERIRVARARANLSMKALGSICGVSAQAVCKWEHGSGHPTSRAIIAMARAMDCSVEWLMHDKPLDFHSTEEAPQGRHAKYWIRAAVDELLEDGIIPRPTGDTP